MLLPVPFIRYALFYGPFTLNLNAIIRIQLQLIHERLCWVPDGWFDSCAYHRYTPLPILIQHTNAKPVYPQICQPTFYPLLSVHLCVLPLMPCIGCPLLARLLRILLQPPHQLNRSTNGRRQQSSRPYKHWLPRISKVDLSQARLNRPIPSLDQFTLSPTHLTLTRSSSLTRQSSHSSRVRPALHAR